VSLQGERGSEATDNMTQEWPPLTFYY